MCVPTTRGCTSITETLYTQLKKRLVGDLGNYFHEMHHSMPILLHLSPIERIEVGILGFCCGVRVPKIGVLQDFVCDLVIL